MTAMKRIEIAATVLGLMACTSSRADASLVTYTEQVTGSGTLNGVAFTDQLVTLTFTGDTANVVLNSGGGIFSTNFPATGTLKVDGGATGNFTTDTYGIFTNNNINIGIYDVTRSATILSVANSAVGIYDLKSPLTISGSPFIRPDQTFSTSLGGFVLSSTSTNPTFTASDSPASVSTPEPSTLAGAALAGVAGLVVARRRRKA